MKFKFTYATEQEKDDFLSSAKKTYPDLTSKQIEDRFEEVKNTDLNVLRDIKNAHKWTDLEDVGIFLQILSKFKSSAEECELTDEECELIKKTCKEVLAQGKITGYGLERFYDFYKKFKL